jgi:hypothetical protein
MAAEIWKDIPGYEGAYQVSSLGRVRSLDRQVVTKTGVVRNIHGKVLSPGRYDGHTAVVLGRKRFHPVHHLVALAFFGPRPSGMQICHANGNPEDNRVENLRYDTPHENSVDVYRIGGAIHKLTIADALDIRKRLAAGETGASLAREFGVSESAISRVKKRKSFWWLE